MRHVVAIVTVALATAVSFRVGAASGPPGKGPPVVLAPPEVRDVEAPGRLFERGIPITPDSFSPDGFHFAYLFHVPGGFLRRKPERCAFLIDLGTGENRPIKTPRGPAVRIGGWDPTGRYLLIETYEPGFLSMITGSWTTHHWILDAVTMRYIPRKPFTGTRDGRRFLWKRRQAYHGIWSAEDEAKVWPLREGELAQIYEERKRDLIHEDNRRLEQAEQLAVGSGGSPRRELAEVLPRLDTHWTRTGQRDPVISELFGERPSLFFGSESHWIPIHPEVEYVAVLDHGLTLITGHGGEQSIFDSTRWELLPLPAPPEGFAELLETRWDRSGGYYDPLDPLPRDLQYRRSFDTSRGRGYYFNYVPADRKHALLLYSFAASRRVLRIVSLPEHWHATGSEDASMASR